MSMTKGSAKRRTRRDRLRIEGAELARLALVAGGDMHDWLKELKFKWASKSALKHAMDGFEAGLHVRGTKAQILIFEIWKAGLK